MELLLNIVWLFTTAFVFVWWRVEGCRTARGWRLCAGAVALLCVALLLFPVISMTDDLARPVCAEDAGAGRRVNTSSADHMGDHAPFSAAVPTSYAGAGSYSPDATGLLPAPQSRHAHAPASRASVVERAPPSLA